MKQPGPVRLAIQPVDPLGLATMGANRAIRPADRLKVLPSLCFVSENRVG